MLAAPKPNGRRRARSRMSSEAQGADIHGPGRAHATRGSTERATRAKMGRCRRQRGRSPKWRARVPALLSEHQPDGAQTLLSALSEPQDIGQTQRLDAGAGGEADPREPASFRPTLLTGHRRSRRPRARME
jgi:hypothetical protein